jgi:hypothetical protein
MTKAWDEMTTEEKLDDLHRRMQHVYGAGNLSADRGNQAFTSLDYRLSQLEKHVSALTIAVEALRGNSQ